MREPPASVAAFAQRFTNKPSLDGITRADFNGYQIQLFTRVDAIQRTLGKMLEIKRSEQRQRIETNLEVRRSDQALERPQRRRKRRGDNDLDDEDERKQHPIRNAGIAAVVGAGAGLLTRLFSSHDEQNVHDELNQSADQLQQVSAETNQVNDALATDEDHAASIRSANSDEQMNRAVQEHHDFITDALHKLSQLVMPSSDQNRERQSTGGQPRPPTRAQQAAAQRSQVPVQSSQVTSAPVQSPQRNGGSNLQINPRDPLGSLSAHYESGSRGSAAIGNDRTGGTSYGQYQISSRTGSMARFMEFIRDRNPELYDRLSHAGNPDAGPNSPFAREWRRAAQQGLLGTLEHDYIQSSHYDQAIRELDPAIAQRVNHSRALQEVMWSTAVQHGAHGAAQIFEDAFSSSISDSEFIHRIYQQRARRFGSSTSAVREAVMNRFRSEEVQAQSIATATQGSRVAEQSQSANRVTVQSIDQSQTNVRNQHAEQQQPVTSVTLNARNPNPSLSSAEAAAAAQTGQWINH